MINLKTAIKTNVIEIIKNCYLITFYDNNLEYWAMQSYKKLICIYCPTTKELLIDKNNFDCTLGEAITTGINISPLIGCICMAASVVITVVVSLFTQKPSKEAIYNAFEKPIENEV